MSQIHISLPAKTWTIHTQFNNKLWNQYPLRRTTDVIATGLRAPSYCGPHPNYTAVRNLDKNLPIRWKTSHKATRHILRWLPGEFSWHAFPTILWSAITRQRVYSMLKTVNSMSEKMHQRKLLQPVTHYRRNNVRLPGHAASLTGPQVMDRALHRSAQQVANSTRPQMHHPRAATVQSGPPASLSRTSKRYILARPRPDETSSASSLHDRRRSSCTSLNPGTSPAGLIQHDPGTCR